MILERQACLELLRHASIGRVGISIDALPVVLPLQFVLSGQAVLVHTVPGTKLDAALIGAVVAFQADAGDPVAGTHWSVLVQGMATEHETGPGHRRVDSGAVPWMAADRKPRLVRIDATLVSGRLFRLGAGSGREPDLTRPSDHRGGVQGWDRP